DESSRHLLATALMQGNQEIQQEQGEDAFHSLRHSRVEQRQRELRRLLAEAELRNDAAAVRELMAEKIALDRLLREG
ncbi:MAG: DNA primase, partial [Acidobacteriaceae bacterium]